MPTLEQQIANLRLQIDALEKSEKMASMPEAIRDARRTVKWSAIAIAIALVLSSMIRMLDDERMERLEKRIELLEKKRGP